MRRLYRYSLTFVAFALFALVLISFKSYGNVPQSSKIQRSRLVGKNVDYNVWCIFTRVKEEHPTIRRKFERMLDSMLATSEVVLSLNLVVDTSSRYIAKDIVESSKNKTGKYLKVVYHEVHVLTNKMDDLIKTMQKHFSSEPGAYYSASLFFLSIGLHKFIFQNRVVMIDADTVVRSPIEELFEEFDRFKEEEVLGAAAELSPVYYHILNSYRVHHNGTKIGSPPSKGGNPGVNSGVLLLDLDKMRKSKTYQKATSDKEVDRMAAKYTFKGHLGDQDFYTLLSFEYPSLVHTLDCAWNRQLCIWWKDHGYREIFDDFAACPSHPIKIYHGNCNSKIPLL